MVEEYNEEEEEVGFYSGVKRPCTCSTCRFPSRRKALVYVPTDEKKCAEEVLYGQAGTGQGDTARRRRRLFHRPVYFRGVHAHRPDYFRAQSTHVYPPAAGRFPFGCEATVYMPIGHRPVTFQGVILTRRGEGRGEGGGFSIRAQSACVHAHRRRPVSFQV